MVATPAGEHRSRTSPRRAAAVGLSIVVLGCGGMLAVLLRLSGGVGFISLFAAGNPGRGTLVHLAGCVLTSAAGAGILMSSITLSVRQRWAALAAAVVLAVLGFHLASSVVVMWLAPLWLLFRYAGSDQR